MSPMQIMQKLYPNLPYPLQEANAEWLVEQARIVHVGGYVISPRDMWVAKKLADNDFEIVLTAGDCDAERNKGTPPPAKPEPQR